MVVNGEDGGSRRSISVQLPEPVENERYETIADIGKARFKAAIENLREGNEDGGSADLGFKAFTLDSSNVRPWDADLESIEEAIIEAEDNLKEDRSEEDVLYEVLLKLGIDLCVDIEAREVEGNSVFVVGAGALVVCLDSAIALKTIEGVVDIKNALQPEVMRIVFRDAGFQDDVAKTNAVQILKQAGLSDEHIRSI